MRRRTEMLDVQTRENLREFLEDMPAEVDDLQQLQDEMEEAQERLAKLLEKEAFVGKRIERYREQLQHFQDNQQQKQQQQQQKQTEMEDVPLSSITETEQKAQKESYQKHLEALQQIEASHKTMQRGIEILEERIRHMEHRQSELKQMTDECDVVYQTAEELRQLAMDETNPNTGEGTTTPSSAAEFNPLSNRNDPPLHDNINERNCIDEELGTIELAKTTSTPQCSETGEGTTISDTESSFVDEKHHAETIGIGVGGDDGDGKRQPDVENADIKS